MSADAASEQPLRCCTRCRAMFRKDVAFCPSDGGAIEETASDPLIGLELGHYTIDALIGEGAMGRVYRVHHSTLSDKVFALKVLIGDLAATQAMRLRFVNEAKSAGRLAHQNVASVVDFGSHEGLIYLVMDLVEGKAMSELIDEGPMDPDRVARLGRGIALGLRHAHELGLVHRDLKPENVIVTRDERGELPKIVDFGIAVSIEQTDTRLTATGIAMGTPAYVAPEQVSSKELDARADQYALGVTLYEALTGGVLPFSGDPVEVVTDKVANAAPALASKMPENRMVPAGLARIVEKMIERRPRDRYEDLGAVIEAFDQFLLHRLGGTTDEVPVAPKKRRTGLVLLAGATVAVAASAVGWKLTRSSDPEASPSPPAPVVAKAPVPAPPAKPTPPPEKKQETVETAAPPKDVPPPAPALPPETTNARDAAVAAIDSVAARDRRRPAAGRPGKSKPEQVEVAVKNPVETPKDPVVVVPPDPVRTPPVPVAVPLQARVLGVDVQGSLSQAVIQRAVDRVRPAIERCTSEGAPHTVQVKFTIDESKRAHGVRSSAQTSATSCLVSALGGVRTDAAPDTGDAEVVVRIAFRSHS